MGALSGAMVSCGAAGATALWGPAWGFVGAAVGGAASGATNAAICGGNIGQGALIGAIGSGVGYGIGYGAGKTFGDFWGAMAGGIGGGAVAGGVGAELSGGSFGQGAAQGAAYGGVGAFVGYGASRATAPRTNSQKTAQQLNTDEKPTYTKHTKITIQNSESAYYEDSDGFRYVGPEEAEYVQSNGKVPNTSRLTSAQKPVFYTVDEPVFSASQAQQQYNLPVKPTHVVVVETREVTNIYASSNGDTTEIITYQKMQAKAIYKLDK